MIAYVDAVVINAYSGAGTTALRIDELSVDGMVSPGAKAASPSGTGPADRDSRQRTSRAGERGTFVGPQRKLAFPPDRVTRILQHNGEPLSWVRSLGFDGVSCCRQPAGRGDSQRSDACAGGDVRATAGGTRSVELERLLEPVAGWYVGLGEALDSTDRSNRRRLTSSASARLAFAVAAPDCRSALGGVEAATRRCWTRSSMTFRRETGDCRAAKRSPRWCSRGVDLAAVSKLASASFACRPRSMLRKTKSIADADRSAASPRDFAGIRCGCKRCGRLESVPPAILFRSTRSLSSGSELDSASDRWRSATSTA